MDFDKDLHSIQEARACAEKAYVAYKIFAENSQETIDVVVRSVAIAAFMASDKLAKMAADETGFGKYEDKIVKNMFASREVYHSIKEMKTVGIINKDEVKKIHEIVEPMGVVAALTPSTNPTSTAIYNALISIKARNAVVIAPHPSATKCVVEATRIMAEAAQKAGAPPDLIQSMTVTTLPGTTELMKHSLINVILATGGMGVVRAAYSSGKPAYGVGPGNVPAYIDRTADVPKAVFDIVAGKTFDNGTICASEQSIVCDNPVREQVIDELKHQNCYLCSDDERKMLERVMLQPNGAIDPRVVGRPATHIAEKAGIDVPPETRALVVFLSAVGKESPLSQEKLSPVLSFFDVNGWEEGCARSKEILAFGGMGHTLSIHCKDKDIIQQFGLEKPAFRICVNTPSTHGAIGYTTGVAPAMTLGPGTFAGSITSDNISPKHLMHIKRLAFELKPLGNVSFDLSIASFERGGCQKEASSYSRTGKYSRFDDEPVKNKVNGRAQVAKSHLSKDAPPISDNDIDRILHEFKRSK